MSENYSQIFANYSIGLAKAAKLLPMEDIIDAAKIIYDPETTHIEQNNVFICGNGGSASTASHITCDFMKNSRKPIQVICLNDNVALLTAWANDDSYEYAFMQQMWQYNRFSAGILISTSGESENVVKIAKACNQSGIFTIGLLGKNKNSRLAQLVNYPIHVESDNIGIVEDLHLAIGHIWTEMIRSL